MFPEQTGYVGVESEPELSEILWGEKETLSPTFCLSRKFLTCSIIPFLNFVISYLEQFE